MIRTERKGEFMTSQRLNERIDDFTKASQRLSEACEQPLDSFIRDSVIQRFEFCWELAWKLLKLRLEVLGVQALNPRDVFKEALAVGLIEDGNAWSEAQRMRNLSSHTYDEKLAVLVYAFVKNEADAMFKRLANAAVGWRGENV